MFRRIFRSVKYIKSSALIHLQIHVETRVGVHVEFTLVWSDYNKHRFEWGSRVFNHHPCGKSVGAG